MKRVFDSFFVILCVFCLPSAAGVPSVATAQSAALTIVSSGPQGELKNREDANEIRIVFSEPMVAVGRIPDKVTAPFVKISPAIAGTFRWSGSTILIFTPQQPLPFATSYQVTVDTSATAVSGRKLAKQVTFRFTTPTATLVETRWYRRGGTVNGRLVVMLTFNQPVRAADVVAALSATLEPHDWVPPSFSAEQTSRLKAADPAALEQFDRKVKATQQVAASREAVQLRPTTDWNRKDFPPSPRMVVLETVSAIPPEAWVKLTFGRTLRSPAGPATPSRVQSYTIEAERAFFITGFYCAERCDPDQRNPIQLTSEVDIKTVAPAITVSDVTDKPRTVSKAGAPKPRPDYELDRTNEVTLEDAGYDAQRPNRKYAVMARADMRSADGQTLGYPWLGVVDNWHHRAFTSFGDGHGVWEKDGGTTLPFYARNLQNVTQWAARLQPSDLMPTLRQLQAKVFRIPPAGPGTPRKLPVTPDRVQSHGMDLSQSLQPGGMGIVWTAVREGTPIARSRTYAPAGTTRTRASLIQVTNLGLTVKDSPQNTLVLVTRLDNGTPVPGARVSIVRPDNSTHWSGTTGADGVAIAPTTPLRNPDNWWEFAFIVMAEKDGDVAYVGSDWNEGISPWEFGTGVNLVEAAPLLRGTVFTDRGVYRLGEEVHLKAVLRHNSPTGIRLLPPATPVIITVRDSQNRIVEERTVRVNDWSSAEWTMRLPADGALGNYSLRALLESDRPKPAAANAQRRGGEDPDSEHDYRLYQKSVRGSFLVAAYRRPDFRVDVTLNPAGAIAGDSLKGVVTARYLFGAPMGDRPISWKFDTSPGFDAPATITDKYPDDRWVFVGEPKDEQFDQTVIASEQVKLAGDGQLTLDLKTERQAGVPRIYRLEGDVEDVSRQHIANRSSVVVHPAPWYVGVKRPRTSSSRRVA